MKRIFNNRINLFFVFITSIMITLLAFLVYEMRMQAYINNGLASEDAIVFQLEQIKPGAYNKLTGCLEKGQLLLFPLDIQIMGIYVKDRPLPFIQSGRSFSGQDFSGGAYSALIGANVWEAFGSGVGEKLSILGADWNIVGIVSYHYETALDDMILLNSTDFSDIVPLNGKIILDGAGNLKNTFQKICAAFPGARQIEAERRGQTAYQNRIQSIFLFVAAISLAVSMLLSYCWYITQNAVCEVTHILGFGRLQSLKVLLLPYYCNTLVIFLPTCVLTGLWISRRNHVGFSFLNASFLYLIALLVTNTVWLAFLRCRPLCGRWGNAL